MLKQKVISVLFFPANCTLACTTFSLFCDSSKEEKGSTLENANHSPEGAATR